MTTAPTTQPAAQPGAKVQRPTIEIKPANCVTDQCHASVKQYKKLHGPVNVNACDACHTPVSAEKHTFKLTREKDKLCGFCHQIDTTGAKVVHKPLERGECLSCHNPHGGADQTYFRGKTMGETCNTCHQSVTGDKKNIHGPVAAGACGVCHQSHTSELPKLLVKQGRELCISCHQELDQQLATMQFKHKPVEGDCLVCHDSHASNHLHITRAEPLALCTTECHTDVRKAVQDAKYKHSAVTQDNACANCHTPHGGDLATLMKDKPVKICLTCHDKEVKDPQGKVIASVALITDPKLSMHGPLREGSCGGCHNVHGSDVSRLLAKPYPTGFYESFNVEKYDLCFACHDKQLVLKPQADGLTGFRNGQENLHFAHVNKDKRGRSCRACHSTHASTQPQHVRESVPYGNWELPINFKKTETGGSCSPGCHQAMGYDRKQAVMNETDGAAAPKETLP
ncbi:MAG: cytochrome c3 family protein [Phycisphaeraceae bacterium]